jgi:tetratricopeptide (TPR) repeat protein
MNPRTSKALVLAAILVVTVVAFSSSFANGFLNWDDPGNVTQNTAIRALGWDNLKVFVTTPLLGMYSPLVYLSYAIDYQVGGLNPTVYHATNLLIHLVNVCLVFLIVIRLSGSTLTAGIVAALFSVHPMNVAAVTPVSVRSSLLFSCLYLAAYLSYLRHLTADSKRWLWLSLALFVLSALAKSAAVVFTLLLVATDYYCRKPITRRSLLDKWPFFLVSLVFGIVTFVFREDTAAMVADTASPVWQRALLACYSAGSYLVRLVVPVRLSAFYPYPDAAGGHLPLMVYAAPLLLAAVAWLAWTLKKFRRPIVFGALFFLTNILLVVKIIPLGAEWMADRYVYLASIGVFFAVAETCRLLAPARRALMVLVTVVLVAGCAAASYARSAAWKRDMAFYNGIIANYPNAALAYSNRAASRVRDTHDAEGALSDCDTALRLDPGYADAYFNRATAELMLGRFPEASADATRALGLNPNRAEYLRSRAEARLSMRDFAGAIADSEKAMALDPTGPEANLSYQCRGIARVRLGDTAGAIADFGKAIELRPEIPAGYQNRANARVLAGDDKSALADYDRAIALNPSLATAYLYRGMLKRRHVDLTGSCDDFRKAWQLKLPAAEALVKAGCQ